MTLVADVEVDGLVAARRELGKAIEITEGELEDLTSADDDLRSAISALEEEGSMQDSLEHAIGCCEGVVEIVEDDLQYVLEMHRAGRILLSNETVEVVVGHMSDTLRHVAEWADQAHSELRGLR